jgi:hypothetical protein
LFVLSAFFIAATVAALTWIKVAALASLSVLLAALARLLATLFTTLITALTRGAIILRVPSWRLMAGLTSSLFHSLISFSVVCHIHSSPLVFPELIVRPSQYGLARSFCFQPPCHTRKQRLHRVPIKSFPNLSIQTVQSAK